MFREIAEALKGSIDILVIGAFTPCYVAVFIILSMTMQNWIPLVLGLSAYLAVTVRIMHKRERKHIEIEKRGLIVSPELQEQRFDEYTKLLKKHENS
jgi:hypothetical protein